MLKACRFAILTTLLGAAVSGCSGYSNSYSHFHDIPGQNWGYYHQLLFDIVPEDSLVTGQLQLVVRHTNDYPFSNLYVECSREESGRIISSDTISVELADIYGNWLGTGLGTSFQRAVVIDPELTVTDSVRIRVRHIMRVDPVREIEQIGIIFTADQAK